MGGPTIRRGESSGDIHTPQEFIEAVESNWGPLAVDLAAETHSAKAPEFIPPEIDSLVQDWTEILHGRRGWLNPPYSLITPWAMKCAKEYEKSEQNEIFLLVPGSVGANWFWDWVWPYATVYSVGRMVFDNCFNKQGRLVTTPYPKDLILAHYTNTTPSRMLQRWPWRTEAISAQVVSAGVA
jgi:phage N-6-adenine-methyltransferase